MWVAFQMGDEIHVVPSDDLIEHTHDEECVCGPKVNYYVIGIHVVIHESLDGREHSEPDWKG